MIKSILATATLASLLAAGPLMGTPTPAEAKGQISIGVTADKNTKAGRDISVVNAILNGVAKSKNGNHAKVVQKGNGNQTKVGQNGKGNNAGVFSHGNNNNTTVNQNGNDSATVFNVGDGTNSTVNQDPNEAGIFLNAGF